jgi:outer membrane lipase/esterase
MRPGRSLGMVAAFGALLASHAGAQNLSTYINDPSVGASDLQIATAVAVQTMCGQLAAQGGTDVADPLQADLFLRCNELVATAIDLQTTGPRPGRSLGVGDEGLLAALQQIAGEEVHGQGTLSTRVTNSQFSNIAGRLNTLRLGGIGAAGGGIAYADPYDDRAIDAPAFGEFAMAGGPARGGGASADVAGSRDGWFLNGAWNTGDRDQSANEDGFDFDAMSFTLGFDYMFDSGVIGFSGGRDVYEAEFDDALLVSGGGVDVEGTTGSLFGAWYPGGFYMDAIVSFGDLDTDVSRRVVYASNNPDPLSCQCPGENRTLTGEASGDFVAAGLTGGYDASVGDWDVSTTLSVSYRDIDIDGYDETSAAPGGGDGLALRFAPHTIESLRSILGLAVGRSFSQGFGVLSPQFRAEWHHEFEDDPVLLSAKYIIEDNFGLVSEGDFTSPDCFSCFQFATDEIDSDFALLGVGLSAVFAQRLQLYGAYDVLLGLENLTSHTVSVGIRGQF